MVPNPLPRDVCQRFAGCCRQRKEVNELGGRGGVAIGLDMDTPGAHDDAGFLKPRQRLPLLLGILSTFPQTLPEFLRNRCDPMEQLIHRLHETLHRQKARPRLVAELVGEAFLLLKAESAGGTASQKAKQVEDASVSLFSLLEDVHLLARQIPSENGVFEIPHIRNEPAGSANRRDFREPPRVLLKVRFHPVAWILQPFQACLGSGAEGTQEKLLALPEEPFQGFIQALRQLAVARNIAGLQEKREELKILDGPRQEGVDAALVDLDRPPRFHQRRRDLLDPRLAAGRRLRPQEQNGHGLIGSQDAASKPAGGQDRAARAKLLGIVAHPVGYAVVEGNDGDLEKTRMPTQHLLTVIAEDLFPLIFQ